MALESEKWSNLEETAENLGVSKDTIRNWIKKESFLFGVLADNTNLKYQK